MRHCSAWWWDCLEADQAKAMFLCELALDLAMRVLRPGGDFLIKIFQGEGFDAYLKEVRQNFDKVQMRKRRKHTGSEKSKACILDDARYDYWRDKPFEMTDEELLEAHIEREGAEDDDEDDDDDALIEDA